MKTKFFGKLTIASMLTSLITPLAVLVPQAAAVTDICTWVGGTDLNFNTAANWSCSIDGTTVPENGDSLVFDVTSLAADETLTNDMVGLSVAGISRTGDNASGFGYTISGNGVTLTGPITGGANTEGGQLRMEIDITFGSDITITNMEGVFLDSPSSTDIGVYNLTVQGRANFTNLIGSGNITVESGYLSLNATSASTYSGDISITGGNISIEPDAVNSANSLVLSGTGYVSFFAGEYDVPITLGGTGTDCDYYAECEIFIQGYGSPNVVLSGGVTLTNDVKAYIGGSLTINEPFTDNGHSISVISGSTGDLVLPGGDVVEPPKETTTINADDKTAGFVVVTKNQTVVMNGERADAYIYDGGVLKGNGTFTNAVRIYDGGTLAPGLSPGCMTMGGLTLAGSFDVEIAGTTVCTQYDQAAVNGSVDLTGGTLNVSFLNNFTPAVNNAFMIINNDAADAVTGTFTGLADGATFQVNGVTFQINYNGGDGNDVMLLVTAVVTPETPETGLQNLISNPLTTLLALLAAAGVLGGLRYAEKRK